VAQRFSAAISGMAEVRLQPPRECSGEGVDDLSNSPDGSPDFVFERSTPLRSFPLNVTTATSDATITTVHDSTGGKLPPNRLSTSWACITPFREESKFPS
jgi:hypothetical protein